MTNDSVQVLQNHIIHNLSKYTSLQSVRVRTDRRAAPDRLTSFVQTSVSSELQTRQSPLMSPSSDTARPSAVSSPPAEVRGQRGSSQPQWPHRAAGSARAGSDSRPRGIKDLKTEPQLLLVNLTDRTQTHTDTHRHTQSQIISSLLNKDYFL